MGALKNTLSYSASRARLLDECPRAFWYSAYASWNGWEANADPRTRAIYVAKSMETWKMWAGSIIHKVIARMLKKSRVSAGWAQGASQGDIENWTMTAAQDLVTKGIAETKSGAYERDPKGAAQIQDILFGWRSFDEGKVRDFVADCVFALVDDGQKWQSGKNPFRQALMNPARIKQVESFDTVEYNKMQCFLAADLIASGRDPNSNVIYDWKTGAPKDADVRQVGVYGLLAQRAGWGATPGVLVYLNPGGPARPSVKIVPPTMANQMVSPFAEAIDMFRDKVLPRLVDQDQERNEAIEELFEVTKDSSQCRFCRFRDVCSADGKMPR